MSGVELHRAPYPWCTGALAGNVVMLRVWHLVTLFVIPLGLIEPPPLHQHPYNHIPVHKLQREHSLPQQLMAHLHVSVPCPQ